MFVSLYHNSEKSQDSKIYIHNCDKKFISRNSDFITYNSDFISHHFEKKKKKTHQKCKIKITIIFYIFLFHGALKLIFT